MYAKGTIMSNTAASLHAPLYDQLARIRPQVQSRTVTRPVMQLTTASVGDTTRPAAQRFEAAQQLVLRWMSEKHRAILGGTLPAQALRGEGFAIDQPGREFAAVRLDPPPEGFDQVWAAKVEHPDNTPEGRVFARMWSVEILLAQAGSEVVLSTRTVIHSDGRDHPPLSVPRFLREIATQVGLSDAGFPIEATPYRVDTDERLAVFWRYLCDPARNQPVLVLTPEPGSGVYALNPDATANALIGVARIVVLTEEQNYAWTRLAGREWVAFKGSVRTYKPDFDPSTQDLFRHPLATLETVRGFRDGEASGADAFGPFITRALYATSVDTLKARQCWTSFAAIQNQRFSQETARARAANDDRGVIKLFEEEVGRLQQRIIQAEADANEYNALADERKEIAEAAEANAFFLRTENDRLRGLLAQRGTDPDLQVPIPNTYDELPEWSDKYLVGRLVLVSRAARSVRSAPYDNPPLVYRALLLLAGVYRQMRLGIIGRENYEAALRALELTESFSISSVRVGEHGDEYYVTYPTGSTRRCLLELHLRKGTSHDPRHALRIYFFWDEGTSQVVVGWLTTHLDTRQT